MDVEAYIIGFHFPARAPVHRVKVIMINDAAPPSIRPAAASARRNVARVVELHGIDEHLAVAELLCRVFRADDPAHVVSADLIRALAHSGNYVAGAYVDGGLAGASIAFVGTGHLHSHVLGVDPFVQRSGVGFALKQHQRRWALERGITEIRWTFDPLMRRNAHFNIHKLSAVPVGYLPKFYGPMLDGVNAGDESDRLYVVWDLAGPVGAVADAVIDDNAVLLLDRAGDRPVPTGAPPVGAQALVATPPDIDRLRRHDPNLALAWRRCLRASLTGALDAGYRIRGIRRDGCYVLGRYVLDRP